MSLPPSLPPSVQFLGHRLGSVSVGSSEFASGFTPDVAASASLSVLLPLRQENVVSKLHLGILK